MFDLKGKEAIKMVKALAKRLGYCISYHPDVDHVLSTFDTDSKDHGSIHNIYKEIYGVKANLKMITDYLDLEIFEGKELRKKKK